MPSFDVVSEVNMQEVLNAVDQVRREISTRFDFKHSKSSVVLEGSEIKVLADDNMKLKAIDELLRQKLAKRGVSLKAVEFADATPAAGDALRQVVTVKQGLNDEQLKRIAKMIKALGAKVQSQIQDQQLRVSGKKKDDLQVVIAHLKTEVKDADIQFINFRD